MDYKVTFYSLGKDFKVVNTKMYASKQQALHEIENYIHINGFSKMREVEDSDDIRITATTPNGRAGRNIARIEYGYEGD